LHVESCCGRGHSTLVTSASGSVEAPPSPPSPSPGGRGVTRFEDLCPRITNGHLETRLTRSTPMEGGGEGPHPAERAEGVRHSDVGIIAIGARVGSGTSVADFAEALFHGVVASERQQRASRPGIARVGWLAFSAQGSGRDAAPATLAAGRGSRGVEQVASTLPRERTSVVVGMQCDAEIARHGARWRVAGWAEALGASQDWVSGARDGFVPLLVPRASSGPCPTS